MILNCKRIKLSKLNELAWLLGTVLCALGVALCTKADFGLSMMAAPPYILHVATSKFFTWYSQGTSEYIWQFMLLILLCIIVRKIRLRYFLSFLSAMFFGFVIDAWLFLFGGNAPIGDLGCRILAFICGVSSISLSVALVFRTYLPPQIAECLVMEVAHFFHLEVTKVKMVNDLICLALSFGLSLILTHGFTGVGVGTIVITLVNAPLIKFWGRQLDKICVFDAVIPKLKNYFE